MATINTDTPNRFNLWHSIYGVLTIIGHAFMRPADAKAEHARRQITALKALSDTELAARGIRREDIELRVFSGTFYA